MIRVDDASLPKDVSVSSLSSGSSLSDDDQSNHRSNNSYHGNLTDKASIFSLESPSSPDAEAFWSAAERLQNAAKESSIKQSTNPSILRSSLSSHDDKPHLVRAVSFEEPASTDSSSPEDASTNLSSAQSNQSANQLMSPPSNQSITDAELHGRYKLVRYIGSGSYGAVYVAVDLLTNQQVAIKKIVNIFDNLTNAKRLLREIKILRLLQHPNVIGLREILPPIPNRVSKHSFNDLLIVFEFVDTDLHKLIHSDQSFTNDHVQYFLYQLLLGLCYMHDAHIIHRDLKPANVLVNSDCSLKICDFGLARYTHSCTQANKSQHPSMTPITQLTPAVPLQHQSSESSVSSIQSSNQTTKPGLMKRASISSSTNLAGLVAPAKLTRELTKHVVTRWYRAPELILLSDCYTEAIDLWSVGCILAELLSMQTQSYKHRMPLFPGKTCFPFSADNPLAYTDHLDQLNVIFDVLGTPSASDIDKIDNDKAKNYLRGLKHKPKINFRDRFPGADERAIDMLEHLLTFDPASRYTAQQALSHPYLADLRMPEDLLLFDSASHNSSQDFEFENQSLDRSQIRDLVLDEVCKDHPTFDRNTVLQSPRSPIPSSLRRSRDSQSEQITTSANKRAKIQQ